MSEARRINITRVAIRRCLVAQLSSADAKPYAEQLQFRRNSDVGAPCFKQDVSGQAPQLSVGSSDLRALIAPADRHGEIKRSKFEFPRGSRARISSLSQFTAYTSAPSLQKAVSDYYVSLLIRMLGDGLFSSSSEEDSAPRMRRQ